MNKKSNKIYQIQKIILTFMKNKLNSKIKVIWKQICNFNNKIKVFQQTICISLKMLKNLII